MDNSKQKEILREHIDVFLQSRDSEDDELMEILENLYQSNESDSSSSSEDSALAASEYKVVKHNDFIETIESFNDDDFKYHMRFKRKTVEYLIERFQANEDATVREYGAGLKKTTPKKMIYMYLWYITNTSSYVKLGNLFAVAKSTVWRIVNTVVDWLISLSDEFLNWPTGEALERTCQTFSWQNNMHGAIGAIDCTRIKINTRSENREKYLDRNQSHSIVLQAVVDADKKFINIYCGEPGSADDSHVLKESELYKKAESYTNNMFPNSTFLLAGPAYAAKTWLVPPFKENETLSVQQKNFNSLHSSARIVADNAFASLKARFRRLIKYTEFNNVTAVVNLVTSACVLHNICIMQEDLIEAEELQPEIDDTPEQESSYVEDKRRRAVLLQYLKQKHLI